MSKVVASAIAGALTLTTAGGFTVAQVLDRDDITLNLDGVSQNVKVKAGTVSDVLDSQNVKVGPHDSVSPSLDSQVSDGSVISVNYGRKVTATVDGKKITRWTTAKNLSDVLSQFNIGDPKDQLSVSRSASLPRKGLSFTATTAKDVTVVHNGTKKKVTVVGTVADALKAAGIKPDSDDKTNPGLGTVLTDGMTINYDQIVKKTEKRKGSPGHTTTTKVDNSLAPGETKVVTKGSNGVTEETWEVVYTNGKKTSEKKIASTLVKKPVNGVIAKGPKAKPAAKSSSSDSGSSSSSSSSRSSSSSNSSATRSSGSGGAPVTGGTTCKASTYGEGDGTAGGPTASGETFNPNAMTAAHKSLPLGSRIRVTNKSNGKTVTVRINDRGPYVAGRCLDLSTAAMNAVGGDGVTTVSYASA